VSKKWKFQLDDKLYDQMWLEALDGAEGERDPTRDALRFAEMLAPTVQAILRAGATPKQVALLLRYFAAEGDRQAKRSNP